MGQTAVPRCPFHVECQVLSDGKQNHGLFGQSGAINKPAAQSLGHTAVSFAAATIVEKLTAVDLASHAPTHPGLKHLSLLCLLGLIILNSLHRSQVSLFMTNF